MKFLVICCSASIAGALSPAELAVVFNTADPNSTELAHYYAAARGIPAENMINVSDGSGKTQRVEMTNVVENGADPNYVRRNILTKGAIVETNLGRVRITSRPGMDGVISGVVIDE